MGYIEARVELSASLISEIWLQRQDTKACLDCRIPDAK
jgi:hypothetical protein